MKRRVKWSVTAGLLITSVAFASLFCSAAIASQKPLIKDNATLENSMLQFKSGGHIIGFSPDRAYFASADHTLIVSFIGTKGVKPVSISSADGKRDKNKVELLGRVEYKDLWSGITLRYDAIDGGIAENTYIVQPGADISKIKLNYNAPIFLQKDGALKIELKSGRGYMIESAPIAWQEIEGIRKSVKVAFKVTLGEVGFQVGEYDKRHPLIIDPTYSWHTFYGSGNEDFGQSIAVNSNGDIYVTGRSYASWNSPGNKAPLHSFTGSHSVFILKLNSSGAYQWHTFYGSGNWDDGTGIALDSSGNVYVSGTSEGTWGSPLNPFVVGYHNAFVLKLNSSGVYQWHTFYGGSSTYCNAIALDSNSNVYIAGEAWGGWGSPLQPYSGKAEIFVLKLDSNGTYLWHTFYGSTDNNDAAYAIAVDTEGNSYTTGRSEGSWGAPLHAYNSGGSAFVLKLNKDGEYLWHTFYGSSGPYEHTYAWAIAANSNHVYISGFSGQAWDNQLVPLNDEGTLFVLKLDKNGAYKWHTFYGAYGEDSRGIVLDANSNVYVIGTSDDSWGTPLHAHTPNSDNIVLLNLDSNGSYRWHTFYGATGFDYGNAIAINSSGNLYATGMSVNSWGSPLHGINGGGDLFILKLSQATCSNHAVSIGGTSPYYTKINNAYAAASDGSSILIQGLNFTEAVSLTSEINVALRGDYDCSFISRPGKSMINGSITIKGGSAIIDSIIIK
jgi:hypothetical protein